VVWARIWSRSEIGTSSQRECTQSPIPSWRPYFLLSSNRHTGQALRRQKLELCRYSPRRCGISPLTTCTSSELSETDAYIQIGFVPQNNPMNLAKPLGLYLSLWKSLSPSAEVPFPGSEAAWTHVHSDVSSSQLAKFHIYVSLHPDKNSRKGIQHCRC
jgi:hypothetical protein